MRFWKFLAFLVLFTIFIFPAFVHAQNEFSVDATVTYNIQDSGKTIVTHDITLEKKGQVTNIKVSFSDAVVGKGSQRHFSVSYENNSFAVRTGEIWEVSIPRVDETNSFRNYKVILKIPSGFGLEAYVSPKPRTSESSDQGRIYTFDIDSVVQTGISAGFGQFQVFSFNLSYHLENPLAKSAQTQIALPPDTAFQKVYIQNINPKPNNVTVDADGNWLATYILSPGLKGRVDVVVSGAVQIFAGYRSFPKPTETELSENLRATDYWQVNDPQIKALAAQLKTPKAIYDYVSTTLKYDFARVQPNVQRMGAVAALQNPDQAICMEFTDLFIALSRAAGIPAREIDGYAYTENPQLQPLGLVADVLHAWPEYYDKDKGVWIPIDPTWASTSGGIDYFNKLDLRHFTFVIHGESSVTPYPPGSYKLGPNPQKDVYVSFGTLPENRITNLNVSISPVRTLPFLNSIYLVNIGNPGPQALYSIYPSVYFDNKETSRNYVDVLPPFSNYQFNIDVPFSLLGKDSPNIIEVRANSGSARIATNRTQVIINSLLAISAFLIVVILIFLLKLKKITFNRLFATIASAKQKIHDKFTRKSTKTTDSP